MDSQDHGHPAAEVVVTAADCSRQDALAVLGLLEQSFPGAEADRAASGGHAVTVWSTTLDAAQDAQRGRPPARLEGSAGVTLQGSPRAVDRVHAVLAEHFTVDDVAAVSGDQEKEIGLRIRSA
ncbi:hypothetical protein [Streptomyces sp. NPDC097981]|uniref:hypothetical protein n=1 Tax=Streptomyces sp. NPDC097981 TaxID=3155428 RepID=UPI00331DA63F